jgi:carbamoyl-phosphate synthase small subunit
VTVPTDALLVLEDGAAFPGRSLGSPGEAFGEVVFNTGMSGYQEVLTDPSYARQIVVMTYPQQGNYGVNEEDPESAAVRVAGFAVREASRRPSSWRARASLAGYLAGAGVVGIEDVDTRALTLHIREAGAMRAAISTEDLDPRSLERRAREQPSMEGADLARSVSVAGPWAATELTGAPTPWRGRTFKVAAFDWGLKRNSLRLLARSGCATVVFPAATPAEKVLAGGFDGVFLSNGPGDPAATSYAVEAVRGLVGRVPLFGICLGHQILARAIGASTYKLKFGHRGANQPVVDMDSGRVEVTSHNHGFAVDPQSLVGWGSGPVSAPGATPSLSGWPSGHASAPGATPSLPRHTPRADRRHGALEAFEGFPSGGLREAPVVESEAGRVALTHWNLNDGTLEGLRLMDAPGFSVQYHPEAAPGPHDSAYLFDRFSALMAGGAG